MFLVEHAGIEPALPHCKCSVKPSRCPKIKSHLPDSNRHGVSTACTEQDMQCDLILVHATGIEPVQPKATALQAAYLSKDRTYRLCYRSRLLPTARMT